ncbi:helix-hairpin-helix domain-containing protein [Saprospiraceae bacterium]|jgi:DNA polymerase (family 10)|nr:helix-hairpin-helix domain-containing protein [Saprospiraceae bacterium]MDB4162555.1 helix-hairpin-helix domain-containing protein [Saprospiraceae bacterium]
MNNKEIARKFNLLGKVMELHDENPFKVRSYTSAYASLRKVSSPLIEMSEEELSEIKGVGKAIVGKIVELRDSGSMVTLQRYVDITPPGILEMLQIRGFGPKKVKVIWNQLNIITPGELLMACQENRLIELKGFGMKTQKALQEQLEFYFASRGQVHYAYVIDEANELLVLLKDRFSQSLVELTGEIRRKMPIVNAIEILTTASEEEMEAFILELAEEIPELLSYKGYAVEITQVEEAYFGMEQFEKSASKEFLEAADIEYEAYEEEESIFLEWDMAFVDPEYRESAMAIDQAKYGMLPDLITNEDMLGVVHNHSTYSDGLHTLKEMSDYTRDNGFQYLVMSDHSKAAFYADGLKEDQVEAQWADIDQINASYDDGFRVYKGIEADILNDGSMDYGNDFLSQFEVVVASIHSQLNMDMEKANRRLIKAIENPHTHILGHMTGRLLLSRAGYPIDHELIIDACAANGMIIELNANPQRLDMDWTWIPSALEKGVMISINPDAHVRESIHYMQFGVHVARKAGLTKEQCLNSKNADDFARWVASLR